MDEPIELPLTEEIFKNFSNARRLAFDIGGSLIKIAFSTTYERKAAAFAEDASNDIYSFSEKNEQIPSLNFVKFETKYIELALNYMKKSFQVSKGFNECLSVKATGGGAHKYKDLIKEKLGVNIEKEDEMQCLIKGCNFLTRNVPNEVFTIDHVTEEYQFKTIENNHLFPYLLVNIGSGASILKVDSENSFQRVGGSTIGGATLWGLGSLLSDANGFDELLELAEKGDNKSIDMLVKDIYGGGYDILGLKDDIIASSFGKATRSALDHHDFSQFGSRREELLSKFRQEDIIKSILLMICYDISQIASLYAKLYNVQKVFFGGYFIHGSRITMKFLKHGISYWSQDQLECLFMRHEGYLGAIGAFLKAFDELDQNKYSWYENFARSSGFISARRRSDSASFDCFELNQEDIQLVPCPLLLDPSSYVPDLVDLTSDDQARSYWFDCFEKTINTYEKQCIKSQIIEHKVEKRATEFKLSYLSKINCLKETPCAYGTLTVRSLLDLREHCMSQFKFVDVYSLEKIEENRLGLELLTNRLEYLNSINSIQERWLHVFKGLLAGNVYDYGAQAFIQKHNKGLLDKFTNALECVDDCLWSQDSVEKLISSFLVNKYKCIAIFVDNSGFDIVLGVLPLAIELLKTQNVKVILCANSKPAINDITFDELIFVVKKACALNPTLNTAFNETNQLVVMPTGSSSPCLDLSRINIELAKCMINNRVDLIILEGMGRALHTNFYAKFKCDSLKVAVIKNAWLANKLGFDNLNSFSNGSKFPVIFKYETI